MANSPNMGLSILTPGVSTGPGWATSLESDKLLLDAHTHVSGQGLQVPSAGLNINAALPFGNNPATGVGYLGLQSQASLSSGVLLSTLQQQTGNLYWNNSTGVPVQLTNGNTINVSAFGGITNLSGTTGALTYSAALSTFIATANTNLSAGWDGGNVTIRQQGLASAAGVTLKSPTSLVSNYNVVMPSGVPKAQYPITMTSSGSLIAKPQYASFNTVSVSNAGGVNGPNSPVAGGFFGGANQPNQSFLIPANSILPGSSLRATVMGWAGHTNSGLWTFGFRAGSTGTSTDTAIAIRAFGSPNTVGSGTFRLDAVATFTAINGPNNVLGGVHWAVQNNNIAGIAPVQVTSMFSGVQIDTTVDNYFTLTCQPSLLFPQQSNLVIDYGSMELT